MSRGIPRDNSINRKFLHRLKIARGHLEKVIKMTEDGQYCVDIVHQSQAIQAALREVDQLMLKNHMDTCMRDAIKKGNGYDVVNEIVRAMEKM